MVNPAQYYNVVRRPLVTEKTTVLQGLRKPVNDLSRGALVSDIVNTVAITAIQAQRIQHHYQRAGRHAQRRQPGWD